MIRISLMHQFINQVILVRIMREIIGKMDRQTEWQQPLNAFVAICAPVHNLVRGACNGIDDIRRKTECLGSHVAKSPT